MLKYQKNSVYYTNKKRGFNAIILKREFGCNDIAFFLIMKC